MKEIKANKEGRAELLTLLENGGNITSVDEEFYVEQKNVRVAKLSPKMASQLIEKNIITKL